MFLLLLLVIGLSSCTQAFGYKTGTHESLVAAIENAMDVLAVDLDRIFGDYTILDSDISVAACEPLDSYAAGYGVRVSVAGVDTAQAYDILVLGRPGLHEVLIDGSPNRAAGYELDGLDGDVAVFDHPGEELEIAANTGCYAPGTWGVDDPTSLETSNP